jgi:hypothetical protein
MAIVQGSQGGRQVRLLMRNQAFRQWHLNLPTLLYLGVLGPERTIHGIMEHAQGGVNKLEMGMQILKLFQGVDLVLLTKTHHFSSQHYHMLKGLTHSR